MFSADLAGICGWIEGGEPSSLFTGRVETRKPDVPRHFGNDSATIHRERLQFPDTLSSRSAATGSFHTNAGIGAAAPKVSSSPLRLLKPKAFLTAKQRMAAVELSRRAVRWSAFI
jgi:hypothetical protein